MRRKTKRQTKRVIIRRGGKEYKYLYVDKKTDPRIGKTIDGYKVRYKRGGYGKRAVSPTIISAEGDLDTAALNKILEKAGDRTTQNIIKAQIENWKRYHKGEKLTIRSLTARIEGDRYDKMFINAGLTVEQAADDIGVSPFDLRNKSNWKKVKRKDRHGQTTGAYVFVDPKTGEEHEFVFRYYGSVWS